MNRNILHWSEMFYQPKLTNMLKNMDPSLFDALGKKFEKIMSYPIQVYVSENDDKKWTVYFNGHGKEGSIRLILYLHDPSSETFGAANLDINKPTVEIVDFVMSPQGKGFGTKIINVLINYIELNNWGFEIMMLMAQDEKAATFWRRVGFTEVKNSPRHCPSMTMPLRVQEKENKITIRVRYNNTSTNQNVLLDEFNLKI
jgi:hypothetical protein